MLSRAAVREVSDGRSHSGYLSSPTFLPQNAEARASVADLAPLRLPVLLLPTGCPGANKGPAWGQHEAGLAISPPQQGRRPSQPASWSRG